MYWKLGIILVVCSIAMAQSTPPTLPTTFMQTLYNSSNPNYSGLFGHATACGAVYCKTVKAIGGDYTTLQAAWLAVMADTSNNCNEIITVDAGVGLADVASTRNNALAYIAPCPSGAWVATVTSHLSSLPAQGSDTETCTVTIGETVPCAISPANFSDMFQIRKTAASSNKSANDAIVVICGVGENT